MSTYGAEPVAAAIESTPDGTLKEVAKAAQKMAAAAHAHQQKPSIQNWDAWIKACAAYEQAGLAYARALGGAA